MHVGQTLDGSCFQEAGMAEKLPCTCTIAQEIRLQSSPARCLILTQAHPPRVEGPGIRDQGSGFGIWAQHCRQSSDTALPAMVGWTDAALSTCTCMDRRSVQRTHSLCCEPPVYSVLEPSTTPGTTGHEESEHCKQCHPCTTTANIHTCQPKAYQDRPQTLTKLMKGCGGYLKLQLWWGVLPGVLLRR